MLNLNNRIKSRWGKFILFIVCSFIIGCTAINKNKINEKVTITPTLVIHGGAGTRNKNDITPESEAKYTAPLKEALEEGYTVLENGGTSINAVIKAIQVLENSPLFNAGVGAVFTYEGTIELDASIMDGSTGMAGAVAGVSRIKSPIEAAYLVMIKSPHVLLTGKGAEEFAEQNGLEIVNPNYFHTEERYQQLLKLKELEKAEPDSTGNTSSIPTLGTNIYFGTVGAVALDKEGNLAAGTSTGGMTNKRYGRVGDSPIIGAGTYADSKTCAVSATGHGEFFIRNVVAYDIAARMKYQNKDLETAANEVIEELKEGYGGVICLDKYGNIAMPFNTTGMYRGFITEKGKATVQQFEISDTIN